jgi:hypothetical protein
MLKTAAKPPMNIIPNITLVYASMYLICLEHVMVIMLVFHVWSTLVFLVVWLVACFLILLGDSSHVTVY